jgi:hypothetical protein
MKMNSNRNILLVTTTVCLLLMSVSALSQTRTQTIQEIIPREVQDAIKRLDSKGRIVELNDLEEGLRQQFSEGNIERHPAYISADFDGNGLQDYAVLLRSEISGKAIVRLVVFLKHENGVLKAHTLEKFDDLLDSIFIDIQSPGKVQEYDSNRTIRMQFPGIARRFFEKSAGIYYWDKKRFNYVQTED